MHTFHSLSCICDIFHKGSIFRVRVAFGKHSMTEIVAEGEVISGSKSWRQLHGPGTLSLPPALTHCIDVLAFGAACDTDTCVPACSQGEAHRSAFRPNRMVSAPALALPRHQAQQAFAEVKGRLQLRGCWVAWAGGGGLHGKGIRDKRRVTKLKGGDSGWSSGLQTEGPLFVFTRGL